MKNEMLQFIRQGQLVCTQRTSQKDAVRSLGHRIAEYVAAEGSVSWARLVVEFPEMGGGDLVWKMDRNVITWAGLSQLGVDAFDYAEASGLVQVRVSVAREELMEFGGWLDLPRARIGEGYETLHWLPTMIEPLDVVSTP